MVFQLPLSSFKDKLSMNIINGASLMTLMFRTYEGFRKNFLVDKGLRTSILLVIVVMLYNSKESWLLTDAIYLANNYNLLQGSNWRRGKNVKAFLVELGRILTCISHWPSSTCPSNFFHCHDKTPSKGKLSALPLFEGTVCHSCEMMTTEN